ncbi:MAG: sugar phosphate nucleotidyltransferase [Bacteroidota bacterium]
MKPTLLILAAGLGSRYGGMKQTDNFGPSGETITDYSIFDAIKTGFGQVVFVISPQMEEDFKTSYTKKFPSHLEVKYVIQDIRNIPPGIQVDPRREKPWGTAHAVLMAAPVINGPFAVINADDFYGRGAYKQVADFLTHPANKEDFCLAGYKVTNTLSEHGTVSRGICETNEDGYLTSIVERTRIKKEGDEVVYLDEEGNSHKVDKNAPVSMNLFGFTPRLFPRLEKYFGEFIDENSMNPKAEIFLPIVVQRMIDENYAQTKVLDVNEKWFGVTYQEDRPKVLKNIESLVENKVYPEDLWGNFEKR